MHIAILTFRDEAQSLIRTVELPSVVWFLVDGFTLSSSSKQPTTKPSTIVPTLPPSNTSHHPTPSKQPVIATSSPTNTISVRDDVCFAFCACKVNLAILTNETKFCLAGNPPSLLPTLSETSSPTVTFLFLS